jgi:hypothetical protein
MRKFVLAGLCLLLAPVMLAQQALNNDTVIKMMKSGLSDDIIVTTINGSPGNYDVSANGLIALKGAGVSDKVIGAMVAKGSGGSSAGSPGGGAAPSGNSNTTIGSGPPPGIDEIGVYYKDKNGAWISLNPEIVNFKTGGVLKSIASAGIVKGDINGHIQGGHAKLSLTFPVVLAVYMPEGTAITEYQLLHLHPNNDSREFRSVTGGVMHVSGGAMRDLIEFQAEKLAPRVFQITLQSTMGHGEYGLLPPGAYGSSNMSSAGKIYAVSIVE